MSEASTGEWVISGNCLPGAEVIVLNTNTGEGVVVEDLHDAGVFSVAVAGKACDAVSITQTQGGVESAEASVLLQAYQNGFAVDPSACP